MRFFFSLLLLGFLASTPFDLMATTFVGGFEGNIWTDYRNWSSQQVPGAGDEAIIPENRSVYVNGAITVGSLILEGGLNSDGNANSSLTVVASFSWSKGGVGVPLFLLQGCASLWQGTLGLGADITNHGAVSCNASVVLDYHSIINYGEFSVAGTNNFGVYHSPTSFENHGMLKKPSIDPSTFSIGVLLFNHPDGDIVVENGELYANIHCKDYGDVSVSSGAIFHTHTLEVYDGATFTGGGEVKITGNGLYAHNTTPITFDNQETSLNANGLLSTGSLIFPHHFTGLSGSIQTPLTFSSTSTVDINGNGIGLSSNSVSHGAFNINANMTFSAGTLTNYGTISLTGPYTIGIYYGTDGIYNHGTVVKPVSSVGTFNMGIPLRNESDGQVLVQNGELNVSGDLYNKGIVVVAAGARLRVHDTHIYDGATFSGGGTYRSEGNGIFLHNTNSVSIEFGEVELASSVSGSGPLTFTGHIIWTNGGFSSPIILSATCVTDMNGGNIGIGGNTTTNYGILNVNSNFVLSAATLVNYGTMNLNGPHVIGIYYGTDGIFNHGIVKKTSASAGVYTMGVPLTNHSDGHVIVENGTLYVASHFINYGGLSVSAGATFKADYYRVKDGANYSGTGTLIIFNNGFIAENTVSVAFDVAEIEWQSDLNGSGPVVFSQHINWKSGNLNHPCNITIAATGILDLSTANGHGIGGTLTNNGIINADRTFYGGGALVNNGTLNLNLEGSYGCNITNNGVLNKNNGTTGDVTLVGFCSNTGTINVLNNILHLAGGWLHAGSVVIENGAEVSHEGYSYYTASAFENGASATGAGTLRIAAPIQVNTNLTLSVQRVVLEQNLDGTGTLTIPNLFEWVTGNIGNTVLLPATCSATIGVGPYRYLTGTLSNYGNVVCTGDLNFQQGAVLNNYGSFALDGGFALSGPYYNGEANFNNFGVFDKNVNSIFYFNTFFRNKMGGILNVNADVLEVIFLENEGTINLVAGAKLVVKNGAQQPGGSVIGTGTLRTEQSGWMLNAPLAVETFLLEINGNISGTGPLTVLDSAVWIGATLSAPINIAAGGRFAFDPFGYKTLEASMTNLGTVFCKGYWNCGADIDNQGTFLLSESGNAYAYQRTFTNTGLLQKADFPNDYYFGPAVINNGSLVVLDDELFLTGGLQNNNTATVQNGATLGLGGNSALNPGGPIEGPGSVEIMYNGSLNLHIPYSFSGESLTLNGDLGGPENLTVNTLMVWYAGEITTGVSIVPSGTLKIGYDNSGGNNSKPTRTQNTAQTPKQHHLTTAGRVSYPLLSAALTNDGTTFVYSGFNFDHAGHFVNNGATKVYEGDLYDNDHYNAPGLFSNNGDLVLYDYLDGDVALENQGVLKGNGSVYLGDLTNSGVVAPGLSPGQLYFSETYTNGSEFQVEIENSNGNGIGHDYLETDGNLVLNGQLTVVETGTPLEGAYTILHCNGGPGCRIGQFSSVSLPVDYTLSYTGESVMIIKGMPASISPSDTTICSGNSVTLTASAGDSYLWSTGETTESIVVTPYQVTQYYVTVTTGSVGRLGAARVQVGEAPYVYVYPGYTTICQGESVELYTSTNGENYVWSTGATSASIVVNPTTNENYTVTVSNATGCTAVGYATVEGTTNTPATPVIEGLPTSVCSNVPYVYLNYYHNGYYGSWTGPNTYGNYFHPDGLSGPQVLTFTPNPGQCALPATWAINVENATWYPDSDGDGYGEANSENTIVDCTQPEGYVANNTDCNDNNGNIHPNATETCNGLDDDCDGQTDEGVLATFYADNDGDGYGDPAVTTQACSAPSGYVSDNTDCNDNNGNIHPNATETCNGLDDDCDGQTDEGVLATFYADSDGDGYGNPAVTTQACSAPSGYVSDNTDCNDSNGNIHPNATETCNGLDDDCDGQTDEGTLATFYADNDGDGYGDPAVTIQACSAPSGYVSDNTDCNDNNGNIHPNATETCNGLDDDCDGQTDEGVLATFYADNDGDGYGDPAVTTQACSAPSGYVSDNTDCNDNNGNIHPNATETCNGFDDDCDGQTDEGVLATFYADSDGDGYGNPAVTTQACSAPSGYVSDNTDCNDSNGNIHPNATETCNGLDDDCDGQTDEGVLATFYADNDGDGYGNPAVTTQACSAPSGYVSDNTDCNDSNGNIHPNATETCNGLDDDCDGQTDEGVLATFYADNDGDGYGDPAVTTQACSAPSGYVSDNTDCNDNNGNIHPNATETCNGLDDDCDGQTDEGVLATFYADNDGDGYGNPAVTTQACSAPSGYVSDNTDCNDNNGNIHPNATETCNGLDDDCDGQTDEGVLATFYADNDGDGYGNPAVTTQACSAPSGYVSDNTDCNDNNGNIHPNATETCNGLDDDCDGQTDEGVLATFYADNDGDGYGNPAVTTQACSAPSGYVSDNTDCNDNNGNIHPNATETCNGLDDDCDGQTDEGVLATFYADNDGDGYGDPAVTTQACSAPSGYVSDNTDCNDSNGNIHPNATETCNGLDDDCDGQTDEGTLATFYADSDGDGYGDPAVTTQACSAPSGYVSDNTDCNDNNGNIHPNATETCNGLDDDCDGQTDEGVLATFYADSDGDGYGNPAVTTQACSAPSGYVSDNTDCNDNNGNIHPNATETCNGLDDDCDGQTDEGSICDNDGDGYTVGQGDCNDNNANIHPGATEICDGLDNNCNGLLDANDPTFVDNTPPTITCPASQTLSNTIGQCGRTVTYSTPTAADNCGNATVTRLSGLASGSFFPVGNNTVVWKATDAKGLTSTCSFAIVIQDTQAPVIPNCPNNITRNTHQDECGVTVHYANIQANDNCGNPTLVLVTGGASGSYFSKGTTNIVWKATDVNGLSSTCAFTVTVVDNQAPGITCPGNQSVGTDPNLCTAAVTYSPPTATDNCPDVSATLQSGLPSGGVFPKGQTNVVWKATDGAGQTKTCSFRIIVNDLQAPTISCPASQTLGTQPNQCSAVATYATPSATDNCAPAPTVTRISGLPSGSTFPRGANSVTWRAVDGSGRSSTCSFTVTVNDTQAPGITCPANLTQNNPSNACNSPVFYNNPTATDNCGVNSLYLVSGGSSGSSFPVGTSTIIWRANDVNGLSASCSFTVTVQCGTSKHNDGGAAERGSTTLTTLDCNIAPNPAIEEVTISLAEPVINDTQLAIFDVQGRLVWQQKLPEGQQQVKFSVNDWETGVYMVVLKNGAIQKTKRLVVKRD